MGNSLTHHGILGQKWGVRRFQNKDGTLTAAGRKRKVEAVKQYNKTFDEAEKLQNYADKKWNDVSEQYKGLGKTRIGRMATVNVAMKERKKNTAKYLKTFDEAEKLQNYADNKWNDVSKQYKELGGNRLSRALVVRNTLKGKSNIAEKYLKTWDEAEKAEAIADKKWNETSEQYKSLGKNRLERILTVHNAQTGKTKVAEKYLKTWDEAEKAEVIADKKWNEVSKQHKALGKNIVDRMLTINKYF